MVVGGRSGKLRVIGLNREIVVLSLARSADAFCNSLLIVLLPLYVVSIPKRAIFSQLPEATLVGMLLGLASLAFALLQPVAAAASDKVGRRKPFILAGLGVLTLATLGFIPAGSYSALVGLRVLQGMAIAATIPTTLALIADYSERGSVGVSMGAFSTARMLGFATGPLVGAYLKETISFEAAFIAGAVAASVSLILVLVFVPEVRVGEEARRLGKQGDGRTGSDPLRESNSGEVGRIMRQLILVGVAIFVMALSMGLMTALETELNRRLNQNAIGYGITFSMLTVGLLLFQIPIGHWSDRIGRKGPILWGMVMMVPLTVLQGFAPSTFWLSVDRFFMGIAVAFIFGPSFALVADYGLPGLLARQMSILTMSFGLGIAAGPLVGGTLAGMLGFEAPFIAGGILSAAAGVMVYLSVHESLPAKKAEIPIP